MTDRVFVSTEYAIDAEVYHTTTCAAVSRSELKEVSKTTVDSYPGVSLCRVCSEINSPSGSMAAKLLNGEVELDV